MVATLSAEREQTDESISTCRFAQRVARVKNDANVNEEVDPSLVIQRLKVEIKALREEIAILKGGLGEGDGDGVIDERGLERLQELVDAYCAEPDTQAPLSLGEVTYGRMQAAFQLLREKGRAGGMGGGGGEGKSGGGGGGGADPEEVRELREQLMNRDNEIAILVKMVKQGKTVGGGASGSNGDEGKAGGGVDGGGALAYGARSPFELRKEGKEGGGGGCEGGVKGPMVLDMNVLRDKKRSFEAFREHYERRDVIDENKQLLRDRYTNAKAMGEKVNMARQRINSIKGNIEQLRVESAMRGVQAEDGGGGESPVGTAADDAEVEGRLREDMAAQKTVYKNSFQDLRELKGEIERIQRHLEKLRLKMQEDFESWYVWGATERSEGRAVVMVVDVVVVIMVTVSIEVSVAMLCLVGVVAVVAVLRLRVSQSLTIHVSIPYPPGLSFDCFRFTAVTAQARRDAS
jgi:kinesin family protein 6/9